MSKNEYNIVLDYLHEQGPDLTVKNLISQIYLEIIPF